MHTHAGLKAATGSPEVTLTFSVGISLDMEHRILVSSSNPTFMGSVG